jgi:hypothetical protein
MVMVTMIVLAYDAGDLLPLRNFPFIIGGVKEYSQPQTPPIVGTELLKGCPSPWVDTHMPSRQNHFAAI